MSFKRKVQRAGWLGLVAVFAFAILAAVKPAPVDAYGLLSSRSIRMSSSANGATNTAYAVGFTTVTAGQTVGSVVIKFCANNPIIGDVCNAPAGFNVNKSTTTMSGLTGNITGLTLSTTNTQANVVLLTRTAGAVANGPVTFTLGNGTTNGFTNPTNSNTTFYARIFLFPTTPTDTDLSSATYENSASVNNDAGGTAMATANVLNVTAKVQETLVFCVWTITNCAGGGSAVNLGDSNNVLSDTTTTYTSTANFDLASNALAGVNVKLKGDTLTSGAFTITPHGTACTVDSVATNVEQFGFRVSAVGAGQSNNDATPPNAPLIYGCLAGSHAFDVANTNSTYGQDIVRTLGATDRSTSTLEFAAKAAGTTEAGVYTTRLQLIATATY